VFVEPVRIFAEALKDAIYGVNIRLPSVPRDSGDAPPPAIVDAHIIEETEDGLVGLDRLPGVFPCLLVSLLPGTARPNEAITWVGDAESAVRITYGSKQTDPALARQDAGYTLRAAVKVLQWLMGGTAAAEAKLLRNLVQLYGMETVAFGGLYVPVKDAVLTGTLITKYRVRDTWNGEP
jgi:hypothetical protein